MNAIYFVIFIKAQMKLNVLKKWDVHVNFSDHQPVCTLLRILYKDEGIDKKEKLIKMDFQSWSF